MKKFFLTITMVACAVFAFAQSPVTFGFKGGVNFAKFTLQDNSSNLSLNSGNWTTFNVGMFVDLTLPASNFSIMPSLSYTGKGGTFSENANDGTSASVALNERLYYLELPVDIIYHVPVAVGDVYFGAGPYVAYGISGKLTANVDDGQGNTDNETENVKFGNSSTDDITPVQFGGNVTAGFKFKSGFLVNANYDFGLTNDIPSASDSGGKNKSNVFSISIGFVLK